MTAVLLPVTYDPPAVTIDDTGLYGVVDWVQSGGELRFLDAGVVIRTQNTGLGNQVGLWTENWLVASGAISSSKVKDRTTAFLDPFTETTVYAYDHNYDADIRAESRAECDARAARALDQIEPIKVEGVVATRLAADAGSPSTKTGLVATVSYLEGELAKLGLTGYFHIGAQWAAYAANLRLDQGGRTPLGHKWVYGGGYVAGLGAKVVVTTQPFGWRGAAEAKSVVSPQTNQYVAVVERSLVIGYEAVLAAAIIG